MNALTRIGLTVGLVWLASFCFGTLDNRFLGFASIAMAVATIIGTLYALNDDLDDFQGRRHEEE